MQHHGNPMIDIRTLIPYARNSRRHSESQISKLAAVIDDFGFTSPLITVGNELKAGHGRLEAVQRILSGGGHIYPAPGRKNGAEPFADWFLPNIDATGWDDNQARAYVIAENRIAELADWDSDLLALELEDLRLADFDIDLTGFDSAALDSIMDEAAGDEPEKEDKPKKSDDDYSSFEIVMNHENKLRLISVINKLKKDNGAESMEQAIMIMVEAYED